MKNISLLFICVMLCSACAKTEDFSISNTLAQDVVVNIHDFENEDGTKANVTPANVFSWDDKDVIGIWPLTVDTYQLGTQLDFALSSKDGASAVFSGSGWGLICDGNYQYASYYPYQSTCDKKQIRVNYDNDVSIEYALGISSNYSRSIYNLNYLYAPAIAPSGIDKAIFNFYQLNALAEFWITPPAYDIDWTCAIISTSDNSKVFATSSAYDLTTATSSSAPEITVDESNSESSLFIAIRPGRGYSRQNKYYPHLKIEHMMSPAALKGKTLNVTLFDINNNKYIGSVNCTKDQVSGKRYKYNITVTEDTSRPTINPSTITGVDLGHPSILFAPFNVGATSPEEPGMKFYFGVKDPITNSDTAYSGTTPTEDMTDANDGAVNQWGNGWRTPTSDELQWLVSNCDKEQAIVNGVRGVKFMKKDNHDAYIFLPKTKANSSSINTGHYYSRTPKTQLRLGYNGDANIYMGITFTYKDLDYIRAVKNK